MPKPRIQPEKMAKKVVEEEPAAAEEKSDTNSQSQNGSQSSFSRASSSLRRARQKYEIILKLIGMLILPVTMVIVLAFIVFETQAREDSDVQAVGVIGGYLRIIVSLTGGAQTERAAAALYMGHPNAENLEALGKERNKTDTAVTSFVDFMNVHKEDLPKIFLYRISRCKWFITDDIPRYRELVDALPTVVEEIDATQHVLTHGIEKCLLLSSRFSEFTISGPVASETIGAVGILKAKELVSLSEALITERLAMGNWKHEYRVLQTTLDARAHARFTAFLSRAGEAHQTELNHLLEGPYGQAWKGNTTKVLALPDGPIEDYLHVEHDYYYAYKKFLEKLDIVVDHVVDQVLSHSADIAYRAWLYCVLAVACCTPILALWAGRAIAKPFSKLETAKKKLKAEKTRHTMQSEALSKFVPFETLELLGLTDITQAEVGTSHIRRLTIKFTYIHNFSALASRLGADNIVSHLNQWVDGVLPHIQRNKGIIDKFMGDGMLIFYYKPEEAVKASIKMTEWLTVRNKEASITGAMPMNFGIGVNTGDVCIGTVGSEYQITTTTIGDEVNIASAMQACCKKYDTTMIITEASKNFGNANSYSFRYLGHTNVKGRAEPIDVFEVLDCVDPEQLALKKQTNIMFQEGIRAYKEDRFAEATRNFQEVIDMNAKDACALHYMNCIEKGVHI